MGILIKKLKLFSSERRKYAVYGALFGFCFPAIAYFILDQPKLLYSIICTAPFFLGAMASIAGSRQDRANRLLKQKVHQLKKAKMQAELGVQAKSRFLATMSHEIRTPMNAVLSCADLLSEEKLTPNGRKLLEAIRLSGDSLLVIINDILDFSKIESGKLELESHPFSLKELISEATESLSGILKAKDIKLEIDFDLTEEVWVLGDSVRLKQVLNNLMSNAAKFTKNKVHLRVTETSEKTKDQIMYKTLRVEVIDNGVGISHEGKERLFKDFSQVDASTTRKYGGTGLGLAICKGIVSTMGGEIGVESQEGEGSTFYIQAHFQLTEPIEQNEKAFSKARSDMNLTHPLRILMAEDNSVNQMVASKLFARLGYNIKMVENGKEALLELEQNNYDIVFLDQHMPIMDGVECAKQIRAKYGSIHYLAALTASAFKEDKDRCLEAGMDVFFTKPINISKVVDYLYTIPPYMEPQQVNEQNGVIEDQFNGMEEIKSEIAESCLAVLPGYFNSLGIAIKNYDSLELANMAHKIKGTVSLFNESSIIEACELFELVGNDKVLQQIVENYYKLETGLDRLNEELESLVKNKTA